MANQLSSSSKSAATSVSWISPTGTRACIVGHCLERSGSGHCRPAYRTTPPHMHQSSRALRLYDVLPDWPPVQQQKVLWLQIPMADGTAMQVGDGLEDLPTAQLDSSTSHPWTLFPKPRHCDINTGHCEPRQCHTMPSPCWPGASPELPALDGKLRAQAHDRGPQEKDSQGVITM